MAIATRWQAKFALLRLTSLIWSTAAVATALVAGSLISALAPLPNISMVFLMAVLFSAVSFGMWPAIYASILSFFSYNFFFIEPLYTFQIAEPYELFALIVFLIVAIVTSALAGRVRDQARAANEAHEQRAASMNSPGNSPALQASMRWPTERPVKFT